MAIYGNIENVDAVLLATVTAEAIHIKGADGKDGASITISNISESTADGGTNTVTFSDGSALKVKNGSKGSAGADGRDGTPGAPGKDGHSPVVTATKSGKTTTISVDGTAIATVEDGTDGTPGTPGTPGKDGHTPVKGTDYWTASDKAEIVAEVTAALPKYEGETA